MIRLPILWCLGLPLLAQYSVEKERAIGQQFAAEVRRQSKPVDDAALQVYVRRVGDRVVSALTERAFEYTFEVVAADFTEPVSLPGGAVFIPLSFFSAAEDEGEFAGMLAHSIAHTALRQGARPVLPTTNAASISLLFMAGLTGCHVDCGTTPCLVPLGLLDVTRTYELEADRFGLELAARAGYPGTAFRRYVERTQAADSRLSALPSRDLRLARIDELLATLPAVAPESTGEFAQIQESLRKLRPPRRPPTLRR